MHTPMWEKRCEAEIVCENPVFGRNKIPAKIINKSFQTGHKFEFKEKKFFLFFFLKGRSKEKSLCKKKKAKK